MSCTYSEGYYFAFLILAVALLFLRLLRKELHERHDLTPIDEPKHVRRLK